MNNGARYLCKSRGWTQHFKWFDANGDAVTAAQRAFRKEGYSKVQVFDMETAPTFVHLERENSNGS